MLVKMKISSFSATHGGFLTKGDVIAVDQKTADRWLKKGIATSTEVQSSEVPKVQSSEVEVPKVQSLKDMPFTELRKLAKSKGLTEYGKLSKSALIELIQTEDEEESEDENDPFFDGSSE